MQWIDNIVGDSYYIEHRKESYPSFKNIKSFDIVEQWSGKSALVKTDSFHRITTTTSERYCISVRTIGGETFPSTFEEAIKIIEMN